MGRLLVGMILLDEGLTLVNADEAQRKARPAKARVLFMGNVAPISRLQTPTFEKCDCSEAIARATFGATEWNSRSFRVFSIHIGVSPMDDKKIREAAYRWEKEGRPEGQADRHLFEAVQESEEGDLRRTWTSDHAGGVVPPEDGGRTTSESIPSADPGAFKPGELASENK